MQGRAMVVVVDGTRQPFPGPERLLITVRDGDLDEVSRAYHSTPNTLFPDLPVSENLRDRYTFLVSASHYRDAGFTPVVIGPGVLQTVQLMLLPQTSAFHFARVTWAKLEAYPKLRKLLAQGEDEDGAERRYGDLLEREGGQVLACLLNLAAAAEQIQLGRGTVLDALKGILWRYGVRPALARDRLFAWAELGLIEDLESARRQGTLVSASPDLHPGATRSYKQVQFGEANLQITLHETERTVIDGTACVQVELDIDYFRDAAAHFLLEVAVNALGSMTDPREVYAFRWMAGQRAGGPEFDPLYTIVRA